MTNVFQGNAGLYGAEGYFWNLKSGIPQMLGGFVLIGIYSFYCMVGYDGRIDSTHGKSLEVMAGDRNFHEPIRLLSFSSFIAVAIQSMISPHHELRFLQPMMVAWCLTIGHVVGYELARICGNHPMGTLRKAKFLTFITFIPAIFHVVLGIYLLTSHQSGTEAAFKYIQQQILTKPLSWGVPGGIYRTVNIHLFAQCHSFPGYSHLHANNWRQNQLNNMAHILPKIHMYDCSPRRHQSLEDGGHVGRMTLQGTESSKFEQNPMQFARNLQTSLGFFRSNHNANVLQAREFKAPDVIVTFDCFRKEIETTFASVLDTDGNIEKLKSRMKSQEMLCKKGNVDACVAVQDEEYHRKMENKLRLVATFDHADFRYDYDDKHIKRKVLVYSRF